MDVLTLLALAVAPGIAISIFIYWKDKFDREPRKILIISFLLGVLSIFPAMVLEILGGFLDTASGTLFEIGLYTFGVVGLSEECSKFFMLRIYPYRKKEFNEPFDGITYSVMVSMGFATLENIMYTFQYGMSNAFVRMFTAVPAHAAFGIIMGYYAGLAKFNRGKELVYLFTGVIYAALLHGAYDFFLMQDSIPGLTIGALVSLFFGLRFSKKAIALHQASSPFQENNSSNL